MIIQSVVSCYSLQQMFSDSFSPAGDWSTMSIVANSWHSRDLTCIIVGRSFLFPFRFVLCAWIIRIVSLNQDQWALAVLWSPYTLHALEAFWLKLRDIALGFITLLWDLFVLSLFVEWLRNLRSVESQGPWFRVKLQHNYLYYKELETNCQYS